MSGGAGGRAGRRSQAGPHLGLAHPPATRPTSPTTSGAAPPTSVSSRAPRSTTTSTPRSWPAITSSSSRPRKHPWPGAPPPTLAASPAPAPRVPRECAADRGSRGRCDPRARLASTTAIKGCGRRRRRPGGPELGGRSGRPGGRDVGRGSGPGASARAQALRDLAPRPAVRRCCCRAPAPGRCTREAPPLNFVGHRMPGASAMHLRRHNLGLWVDNIGGATEPARSWPCSTSQRPRGPTKKEAR